MEDITGIEFDGNNFHFQLEKCQEYLLSLFPIFSKIYEISENLSDADIEKMLDGFKSEYRKIKIKPLDNIGIKY